MLVPVGIFCLSEKYAKLYDITVHKRELKKYSNWCIDKEPNKNFS